MRSLAVLLAGGMLAVPVLWPQNQQRLSIDGYVTRATSNSDFDVNGIRVFCDKQTEATVQSRKNSAGQGSARAPYVGESVTVRGVFHEQDRSITAKRIAFADESPGAAAGSAVIDGIPASKSASHETDSLLVRADGYRILIDRKTKIVWIPPLASLQDLKPGDWIEYEGEGQTNGIVIAKKVKLTRIAVSGGEQKFRFKSDYDPSRVPASAKQNLLHKVFLGEDYKNIPPAKDPQMQARVEAIGKKLIPPFQRDLPISDPAKIDFRFQVTDDPKWRDVTPLPSGIILIPQMAAERMQNDSQLAAILASSIAATVERGPFRMRKAIDTTTAAAYLAYWPTGPGIGDAARVAARHKQEQQSDRVSLWLMHDAGYDIDQAPIAWWLLASTEPKPISEIPMPRRTADLYGVLGECWNNPDASTPQAQ